MKRILIPLLLFLLTIFVVGKDLEKPFIGIHDWNGARYGNIARNYLKYGYLNINFAQVENSGTVSRGEMQYYTHYPPALPILISFSYKIFGVSEKATRLVPLLATAGTITVLYLTSRLLFGNLAALFGSFLVLVTPMVLYFGKNPVHEPLAVFFASISFLGVARFLKKEQNGLFLVYLGLILTLLTNWSGLFLLASLLVFVRQIPKKHLIVFILLGLLSTGIHFAGVLLTTGTLLGGGLKEAFLQRTAIGGTSALTSFSPIEFINRLRLWFFTQFTTILFVIAAGGFLIELKKRVFPEIPLLISIFIYCLLYSLVFPNATYIHSYYIFAFVIFIALTSAALFNRIKAAKAFKILLFGVLLLIVFFERNDYLSSLRKSSGDKVAQKLGLEIKDSLLAEDTVLVTPFSYAASRLPIIAFYSDRRITILPDSSYNWIVEVDEKNETYKLEKVLYRPR